jgi:homoserine kinase
MVALNSSIKSASAFAPATCANVAVGFDILGFALQDVGDVVTLTRREDSQIIIEKIDSKQTLPLDPNQNIASYVIKKICEDLKLNIGFNITIKKNIPLSSGMGGSAASAVAALVAFNYFLDKPLSKEQLARYALMGEAMTSGQAHADNIVPCLWGGLTLIKSIDPIEVVSLPIPDNLFYAVVHPDLHVSTKQARAVLSDKISLKDFVKQSANLANFISALYTGNSVEFEDVVIEPQRSQFVPEFYEIKKAALGAGALGFSFSGSGPSLFALAKTKKDAEVISAAIQSQLKNNNIRSDSWVSNISQKPAHIIA